MLGKIIGGLLLAIGVAAAAAAQDAAQEAPVTPQEPMIFLGSPPTTSPLPRPNPYLNMPGVDWHFPYRCVARWSCTDDDMPPARLWLLPDTGQVR